MNQLDIPVGLPNFSFRDIITAGGTIVIVGRYHHRSLMRWNLALDTIPREFIHHAERNGLVIQLMGGARIIFTEDTFPEKLMSLRIQGYCIMEEAWDNPDLEPLLQHRMEGLYVKPRRQQTVSTQTVERGIGSLPASWYHDTSWEDVRGIPRLLPESPE